MVLEVKDLKVSYGQIEALKGVSMRIDRGEFVGVIGANGAGKTSLLMALSGAVRTKGGSVTLDGRDVTHLPQHLRVSNGIAISGATNVTISACDLTDNGGNNAPGHGLNHNLLLNHVSQGTVSESRLVFSLGGSGISVQNSSHVTVQRNELSRNCGWGAEFLNCTDVQLRESLLEANDGGPYRSETDGVRSQVKVTSLVERLNGN